MNWKPQEAEMDTIKYHEVKDHREFSPYDSTLQYIIQRIYR